MAKRKHACLQEADRTGSRRTGEPESNATVLPIQGSAGRQGKLINHKRRDHGLKRQFPCQTDDCYKAFDYAYERDSHIRRKHLCEKGYGCDMPGCTTKVYSKGEIKIHKLRVHGDLKKPFQCELEGCNAKKGFFNRSELDTHFRVTHEHEKVLACLEPDCGREFSNLTKLKAHNGAVHKIRRCDICGTTVQSKQDLIDHKKVSGHGSESCLCGMRFFEHHRLEKHVRMTHPPDSPHKCPECGITWRQSVELTTHRGPDKDCRAFHQELDAALTSDYVNRTFTCHFCRVVCPEPDRFTTHYLTKHTKHKLYVDNQIVGNHIKHLTLSLATSPNTGDCVGQVSLCLLTGFRCGNNGGLQPDDLIDEMASQPRMYRKKA
jgi:hypothetical protein